MEKADPHTAAALAAAAAAAVYGVCPPVWKPVKDMPCNAAAAAGISHSPTCVEACERHAQGTCLG
jgi:hypothetical protein